MLAWIIPAAATDLSITHQKETDFELVQEGGIAATESSKPYIQSLQVREKYWYKNGVTWGQDAVEKKFCFTSVIGKAGCTHKAFVPFLPKDCVHQTNYYESVMYIDNGHVDKLNCYCLVLEDKGHTIVVQYEGGRKRGKQIVPLGAHSVELAYVHEKCVYRFIPYPLCALEWYLNSNKMQLDFHAESITRQDILAFESGFEPFANIVMQRFGFEQLVLKYLGPTNLVEHHVPVDHALRPVLMPKIIGNGKIYIPSTALPDDFPNPDIAESNSRYFANRDCPELALIYDGLGDWHRHCFGGGEIRSIDLYCFESKWWFKGVPLTKNVALVVDTQRSGWYMEYTPSTQMCTPVCVSSTQYVLKEIILRTTGKEKKTIVFVPTQLCLDRLQSYEFLETRTDLILEALHVLLASVTQEKLELGLYNNSMFYGKTVENNEYSWF